MSTRPCPHTLGLMQPVRLDRRVHFSQANRLASLESLPNELLAAIVSYLIPADTSLYDNLPEKELDGQPAARLPEGEAKPSQCRRSNPLNFMAANSLFYHIARQHPALKHRTYSARISPKGIEFEGHTSDPLERLRGAISHIPNLELVLDVGKWGFDLHEKHLSRFVSNLDRLSKVLDGPRAGKRCPIRHMQIQGTVVYDANEGVVPDCMQRFADQCTKALWSGKEADLEEVRWWVSDDDEGIEEETVEAQERSMAGLVGCVRNREFASSLRVMASFLYKDG